MVGCSLSVCVCVIECPVGCSSCMCALKSVVVLSMCVEKHVVGCVSFVSEVESVR